MFFPRKRQVVCVGSTSKDIFFPTDEGEIIETPEDITAKRKAAFEVGGKYRVPDRYEAVGGVAANVAQALARLGIDAAVMSNIGRDGIGDWIRKVLADRGVATDLLAVDPEVESDLSAIIVLEGRNDRIIFHNRDANERLEVDADRLRGAEWIFTSSLNGDWESKIRATYDAADRHGSRTALNPGQHNLRGNPKLVLEMAGRTDVLLLNKDEAIELILGAGLETDHGKLDDESFLLRTLADAGAGVIGLTDGMRGAWGWEDGKIFHAPARSVPDPVDTTGAGDAFAAAFFASYAFLGKSVRDALRAGIVEAGNVVNYYGASEGHLAQDELMARAETVETEEIA